MHSHWENLHGSFPLFTNSSSYLFLTANRIHAIESAPAYSSVCLLSAPRLAGGHREIRAMAPVLTSVSPVEDVCRAAGWAVCVGVSVVEKLAV